MPLILLELPLLALFAPILLYVLAKTEAVWLRPLVGDIAAILRKVWIVGGTIADSLLTIEQNVAHYMNTQVLQAEQPAVRWLGAARTFVVQVFYTAANTAVETGRAVEQLAHLLEHEVAVPAKVTWRKVTRTVYRIDKKTAAKIAAAAAALLALKHTATVTVPGAIAGDLSDLRGYLNRRADRLSKRLGKLEKLGLAGLSLAGLYALLRKAELSWVRLRCLKKRAPQICQVDPSLLDSLIADTLLVVGTISLLEFAEGLQTGMGELTPQIRKFWRAV